MVQQSIEDEDGDSSRRASGRARKLTAKAQALSGSKILPADSANMPDLDHTPLLGSSSTSPDPNEATGTRKKSQSKTPSSETSPTASQANTPAKRKARKSSADDSDAGHDALMTEGLGKRASKRERKPTARALEAEEADEVDLSSRKRSASPTGEEPPAKVPRKSVGKAPKVPSKLRHSMSVHDDATPFTDMTATQDISAISDGLERMENHNPHPVSEKEHKQRKKIRVSAGENTGDELGSQAAQNSPVPTVEADNLKQNSSHTTYPAGNDQISSEGKASPGVASDASSEPPRKKHHNQYTKAKEREAQRRAEELGLPIPKSSSPPPPPKSDRPKHPNQWTKLREREAEARRQAAAQAHAQAYANRMPGYGMMPPMMSPYFPAGPQTGMITPMHGLYVHSQGPRALPPPLPSQGPPAPTAAKPPTLPSPSRAPESSKQKRLIITMPLPSAAAERSPTFPIHVRKGEFEDKGCQLFCLEAGARIRVFAQMAAESSDSDDDDDDETSSTPGLYDKWLERGRDRYCVCGKSSLAHSPKMLTQDELTSILEPNGVIHGQGNQQTGDASSSSSSAMSLPPVNSIVKASEGRRVSAFYDVIKKSAPKAPVAADKLKMLSPSGRQRKPASTTPSDASKPVSILNGNNDEKRSADEQKMADDHQRLSRARKEAQKYGINIRYSMTPEVLEQLVEDRKAQQHGSASPSIHENGASVNDVYEATTNAANARSTPIKLTLTNKASNNGTVKLNGVPSTSPDPLTEAEPKMTTPKAGTPRKRRVNSQQGSPINEKRQRGSRGAVTSRLSEAQVMD